MKTLLLVGNVEVRVRKTRMRSLQLTVRPGGEVMLSLPYFISYQKGLAFLQEKSAWIVKKQKELARVPASFLRQGSEEGFHKHRAEALTIITLLVKQLGKLYRVQPRKISIRNQKTRWGSCSKAGTLCFSYRITLLPERLRDYVIVHELCHLKEFNHSGAFWNLVAQTFPDYRELRRSLRRFPSS